MMFPKTLAAARRAKGAEWALADALVLEIGTRRGNEARFRECAAYLAEYGIEYTIAYLYELHHVARAFPSETRASWLTPNKAVKAGTPAVAKRAEADKKAKAEDEGIPYTPPTQREVVRTRKVVTTHARKVEGRPMPTRAKPETVAHVAEHATKDEVASTIDLLTLESQAAHAREDARNFMKTIAGKKMRADLRRDLLEDVDATIEAWQWVRGTVENPLSDEVEDWLNSLA